MPPPQVNITNEAPDAGLHGWAVPIATLAAAAVAGIVLSINEVLKRRREDRRQWDKEIRDIISELLLLDRNLLLWAYGSDGQISHVLPVRDRASLSDLAAMAKGRTESATSLVQNFFTVLKSFGAAYEKLRLISQPATFEAFRAYHDAVHRLCVHGMNDDLRGSQRLQEWADMEASRANLIASLKEDIRIETWYERAWRSAKTRLGRNPAGGTATAATAAASSVTTGTDEVAPRPG